MPFLNTTRNYDGLQLTVYEFYSGKIRDTFGRETPFHQTILKWGERDLRECEQGSKPTHLEHPWMRKKLASKALHDGKATELVRKTTSRGIPEHVAYRERYAIWTIETILTRLRKTQHRYLSERTWTNSYSQTRKTHTTGDKRKQLTEDVCELYWASHWIRDNVQEEHEEPRDVYSAHVRSQGKSNATNIYDIVVPLDQRHLVVFLPFWHRID